MKPKKKSLGRIEAQAIGSSEVTTEGVVRRTMPGKRALKENFNSRRFEIFLQTMEAGRAGRS